MVATPASAHLPQAEGYTDISQRFVKEARTGCRTRAEPHHQRTLTSARTTGLLPGLTPDMPVFTGHHG